MNLIQLAARFSREMRQTAMQDECLHTIDAILSRLPKHNPHKSAFRWTYGQLRGAISGNGSSSPTYFLCYGETAIQAKE